MAFTQNTFATVGAQAAPSPSIYSYSSLDTTATVTGTAYFLEKENQLIEGDVIIAFLSDGHAFLEVLSDTSTVKIIDIAVSVDQNIREIAANDNQLLDDDIIFCTATLTFTLVDPTTAFKAVTVRSITGTTTLSPSSGTVETTTLTIGQSVTLAPRASGWFVI